jgi:hypothetical protein
MLLPITILVTPLIFSKAFAGILVFGVFEYKLKVVPGLKVDVFKNCKLVDEELISMSNVFIPDESNVLAPTPLILVISQ